MKKVSFNLSTESIATAIKELEEYKKQIKIKSQKIVKALVSAGIDICSAKILEMDIYDEGNLANSVSGYYSAEQNAGYIKVDCEYAVYVEFGTGTMGVKNRYPGTAMNEVGYQYGAGTNYFTTNDGRVGWIYFKDGQYHFTEGLPSRPFMYETGIELRNKLESIVKLMKG